MLQRKARQSLTLDMQVNHNFHAMTESLKVISLISGGKDSFYSLLHCLQNGHKVIALGNLYPSPSASGHGTAEEDEGHTTSSEDEHDLNSFMYQTVGHTVIPLYEQALGIPLYRQPISGTAVQTGTTYEHADVEDETESLIPLLTRIMAAHPTANALSTGAILSTYQRTRIESVALRLGLTPLSYLWQYPILPPCTQSSLLSDMEAVELDARIVKVASGGLDESFLWTNVADPMTVRRIEKAMGRFGVSGDGAVLGEGGEFETLVMDGPASVFRGRIVVEEKDKRVVREGGGAAWLKVLNASVVMKEKSDTTEKEQSCRIPDLLEERFTKTLGFLEKNESSSTLPVLEDLDRESSGSPDIFLFPSTQHVPNSVLHWTVQEEASTKETISDQASKLTAQIKNLLHQASLESTSITSTTIILRSMSDFAAINKVILLLQQCKHQLRTTDLRRTLFAAKSSLSRNHILRLYSSPAHKYHHPPRRPLSTYHYSHTSTQSSTCSITLLLGACQHRSVLASYLHPPTSRFGRQQ